MADELETARTVRRKLLGQSEGKLTLNEMHILSDNDSNASRPQKGKLKIWATADAVNGFVAHFRAKGAFASLVDDNEYLGFVAKEFGDPGNEISVEYISPGENSPLSVTVVDKKITINLETAGDAISASHTTELGGDSDLTFTAKTPGTDGNTVSVQYTLSDIHSDETVASAADRFIEVALAGAKLLSTQQTDDSGTCLVSEDLPLDNTSGVTDTYVSFGLLNLQNGPFTFEVWAKLHSSQIGQKVTTLSAYGWGALFIDEDGIVNFINENLDQIAHSSVAIDDTDWHQIGLGKDGNDVFIIIDGVDVTVNDGDHSNPATGFWSTCGPGWENHLTYLPLSGPGRVAAAAIYHVFDSELPIKHFNATGSEATANDVLAAIEADVNSDALVSVVHSSESDGSGVVLPIDFGLQGGTESGETVTTTQDVVDAIEANPEASALVNVQILTPYTMFDQVETNLSGGNYTQIHSGTVSLS